MSINLDANQLFHKLNEAGSDWADKEAAANVLEDTRHAVLARLMLASDAPSVAAREVEARASVEYEAHVKATQAAKAEALKARVKYDSMRVWVDLQRTAAANEGALAKL